MLYRLILVAGMTVSCATSVDDFLQEDGPGPLGSGAGGESSSGGDSSSGGASPTGGAPGTGGSAATNGGSPGSGGDGGSEEPATTSTGTTTGPTAPTGIYFSEYVEGSSNNKALEIYNGGPSSVALGDCHIDRYQNGSTSATSPIPLDSTTLAAGQTFVVCHTSFQQPSLCDKLHGNVQHTGNDAFVLVCNDAERDSFGKRGEDAVWGAAPTSSADTTLRRRCSAGGGDTDPDDAFDPAIEWEGYPVDTFSDLGQFSCP